MKAIMYHYVRPEPADLPHLHYLSWRDFKRQLDWFERTYGFMDREDFFRCFESGETGEGVVLTFDDGFSDHWEYVFAELTERGLWGIFYIPTAILEPSKLLDVHRIHVILGKLGGVKALHLLEAILSENMLSHDHIEEFRGLTYQRQSSDDATLQFKRILNYFVAYRYRETILDQLISRCLDGGDEAGLARRYYLHADQVREMHEKGMVIGSHGVNHLVMSKLSATEQRFEIAQSFATLKDMLGVEACTFCYPYGGNHSFTRDTVNLLAEQGCSFSFNVDPRDVEDEDLAERRQELPRFDCNQFPPQH